MALIIMIWFRAFSVSTLEIGLRLVELDSEFVSTKMVSAIMARKTPGGFTFGTVSSAEAPDPALSGAPKADPAPTGGFGF
eukprot:gene11447-3415_t